MSNNLRNTKDLSISEIQRTLKINWLTAKKYADGEFLPKSKIKNKRGMLFTSEWGEILSCWLSEDARLKKKLRRTNKNLFLELKELGLPGSYRTVSYFIADWRSLHLQDNRIRIIGTSKSRCSS